MKCLLISDMEADFSAASLNVHVGSALDPKPFWGTAHFLEHMLFMGTEKYPSENEYSEFISNNGGDNNAWTSMTDTNYQFSIANEAFEGGLDRFAQFFISPLFDESSTEREMKAVDSEHNQGLQSDAWRKYELIKTLANEESPFNRFSTGNLKSLKIDGIRETLLDFHKKWYSSNIMNLVISGKHSIEQMEQWTIEKFGPVENKDVVVPSYTEPILPFTDVTTGKLVKLQPIKDKDTLELYFVFPYLEG